VFRYKNFLYSVSSIVTVVILLIALSIRVYSIADRPLHNDEGVNYFFVRDVLNKGYYPYSHLNYHGPSFFYLLTFFCHFFGFSEMSIRSASILPSLILCFWVLFRSSFLYLRSRIFISLMLAVSTTFVYYSRYAIHETLLVLASFFSLHYFFTWTLRKSKIDLILFFLSLAVCIITKETFIIHAFALLVSAILIFPFKQTLAELRAHYSACLWGIFLSLFLIFVFYSGFFRNSEGIRELFYGVPQWIGRGHSDTGHYKPYNYYFKLFFLIEIFPLFLLFPVGNFIINWLNQQKNLFQLNRNNFLSKKYFLDILEIGSKCSKNTEVRYANFFGLYAMASFFAYSYVPYKTPWLIINMTVPAIIANCLFLKTYVKSQMFYYAIVACFFSNSLYNSLRFNFLPSSLGSLNNIIKSQGVVGDLNPLAYVHTQPGMVEVAEEIRKYVYENKGTKILIAVGSYWPMPYYLREFESQLMYLPDAKGSENFKDYDVVVANSTFNLDQAGWVKNYYRLSDNQESNLYLKNRNYSGR
jgi:uncharacterized protein (TIGR03663 family)